MNKLKKEKEIKIKEICYACGKTGHIKHNCPLIKNSKNLKSNSIVSKEDLKKNNIKCTYCGSSSHLICNKKIDYYIEDYDSDNVLISDSSSENEEKEKLKDEYDLYYENYIEKQNQILKLLKRKRVFLDLPNEKIPITNFCYKCGGRHKGINCMVYENKNNNNYI